VAANDLKDDGMPKLQKSLSGVDGEGFIGIPDLVADGGLRSGSVQARLEEACSGRGKRVVQCEYMVEDVCGESGADGLV